jgi:Cytochrome c554 and c-prime
LLLARLMIGLICVLLLAIVGYHVVYSQITGTRGDPIGQPLKGESSLAIARPNALGSISCSGQGCHGKSAPEPLPRSAWGTEKDFDRWQSSYSVWKAHDPHTRAYAVLHDARSKKIVERLGGAPAYENVRCLACHVNPTLAVKSDPHARSLHLEGVGCEACHGNAGPWIADHTSGFTNGMSPLFVITMRAAVCVGCHVGAPAEGNTPLRDMNHDMIAAGHPRLNFDYLTYLRALPPHWLEKNVLARKKPPPSPEQDLHHWSVGRAVAAEASMTLLTDRVPRGPWPELAEFDCSSCHHELVGKQPPIGMKPGELRWSGPLWTQQLAVGKTRQLQIAVQSHPGDTAAIRELAIAASEEWQAMSRTWYSKLGALGSHDLTELLERMKFTRWDDSCQGYYLLTALEWSGTKLDLAKLSELRKLLELPRTVNGERFTTPKDYDPKQVQKLFGEIIPKPVK